MADEYNVGSTITNVFVANTNPVNPTKTGLVFGGRTLSEDNQIIPPQSNNPMPNLYVPFELGAYTNGLDALAALAQLGFQYTLGLNFDTTFVSPDTVTTDTISGLVTLTWDDPLMGIQYLVGQNPVGSATQGSSAGTIKSATIVGDQSFLVLVPVTGTPVFNTSDPVVITAELAEAMPDPETSDEICVQVFAFYNQYSSSATFTTSPNLWCSVYVTDRDISISPTATTIELVAPTTAVAQPDDSVNLTYPIAADNLGLLPNTYLGNTTVTQTLTLPTDSIKYLYYANGVYLAGSADNTGGIYYSLDGASWVATNVTTHTINKFYWNGSVYVAATNAGLYYSANGITWTVSNTNTGTFVDVNYGNTKFVAASTVGLFYSSDGITWTGCAGDDNASFTTILPGIGDDGFIWVAGATGATHWLYTSTDGLTFTVDNTSNNYNVACGAFAEGDFVIAISGGILYSANGTTWSLATIDIVQIQTIVFNTDDNLWLAGTDEGVYTSTNIATWTQVASTSALNVKCFAWNDNLYVMGTATGIYYSTNTTTWTIASGSGATGNYNTILYQDLFVAGSATALSVSANGILWSATSATVTGIYNGYTLTSTTCVLNIINVSGGSFNSAVAIEIVLDITQNGFKYTGDNQISSFGMGYNIVKFADGADRLIDVNDVPHNDFYDGIVALQNPAAAQNNKFHVQGYYAYVAPSINAIPIAQLTAPNVVYFKATAKLDVPTALQYPANAAMVTMCSMFNDLNNEYPYLATNGTNAVLALTASTNQTSYPSTATLNQLTGQGWTALGINSTNQPYIFRNVCTLQSISNITDKEYRYQDIQLKTRWLDENLYVIAEGTSIDPATGMRFNNNPELITNMQKNLSAVLVTAYNGGKGIVGNTKNDVTVTLNPADVTRLLIIVTTTIVASNSGNDIILYVYSYSI